MVVSPCVGQVAASGLADRIGSCRGQGIGCAMRMLVWYWGRRGGGPRYTLELVRALAARPDVDLTVSLSSGNELRNIFGLPVFRYFCNTEGSWRLGQ